MKKKEYQEKMNNEDKTLVNFHPELNQSLAYDNEGNRLKKKDMENFDYIPRGFIDSGLIFKLTRSSLKIYFFLSSKCYPSRNTWVTNDYITRGTGISGETIKRSLKELRFYHFISSRKYFTRPNLNRSRRVITLLRWGTAYKRLVIEGKIKAISGEDIVFIDDRK